MLIICDEAEPCCSYSMAIICVCDINVVVASWGLGTLAVVTVVMVTISQLTRRQPGTASHGVWGPQRAAASPCVRVRLVFRRHFYFHPLLKTSSYGIHQSCHSQPRHITYSIFWIPYFIHIDELLRLDSTFNAAWLITSREDNDDTVTSNNIITDCLHAGTRIRQETPRTIYCLCLLADSCPGAGNSLNPRAWNEGPSDSLRFKF